MTNYLTRLNISVSFLRGLYFLLLIGFVTRPNADSHPFRHLSKLVRNDSGVNIITEARKSVFRKSLVRFIK